MFPETVHETLPVIGVNRSRKARFQTRQQAPE
jgi:hypothetical protein